MIEHELLTSREVADLLRISVMSVYRAIESGEIEAVTVGRSYRIRAESVRRLIAGDTGNNVQVALDCALEALRELSSESCTYVDCRSNVDDYEGTEAKLLSEGQLIEVDLGDGQRPVYDVECPGEVCTARKAVAKVTALLNP